MTQAPAVSLMLIEKHAVQSLRRRSAQHSKEEKRRDEQSARRGFVQGGHGVISLLPCMYAGWSILKVGLKVGPVRPAHLPKRSVYSTDEMNALTISALTKLPLN
jgi:hypothetical protein